MKNELVIRPYADNDLEQVVALWEACFPNDPPRNHPRTIIARKRSVQPELFLVGQLGEHVVCTVLAGYDGFRGWLYHLATDPDHRRRGYAGQLVTHIEGQLSGLGCPKLNLQVRGSNAELVQFYRRLGYEAEERVSLGKQLPNRVAANRLDRTVPHLTLLPIEEVDPEVILEAVDESRRELARWMPWCTPEFGLAELIQFQEKVAAERAQGRGFAFGIIDANGAYCGTCGINAVNVNRYGNLGYWVRTSRTGAGIATAAVGQLAKWAFEHTELHRLEIVMPENHFASQRVAERAGALREALLRQRVLLPTGQVDAIMYSILRE